MDGEKNIFCFSQTAETGNRTQNSDVKGSGANHYPRPLARNPSKRKTFVQRRRNVFVVGPTLYKSNVIQMVGVYWDGLYHLKGRTPEGQYSSMTSEIIQLARDDIKNDKVLPWHCLCTFYIMVLGPEYTEFEK